MSAENVIWLGLSGSLAASAGTAVGAMGVLAVSHLSQRLQDVLLSAAAGVMLAATFVALLLPAIDFGQIVTGRATSAVAFVMVGFLIGAAALHFIHQHAPHEHFFSGREGPELRTLSRIWLFVIAITLHNFPEGMAVGAGFAGGDIGNGLSLVVGIGIQNIPEGLAVAVSLLSAGYSRARSCLVAILTGLVEPIGGLVGSIAVSIATQLTPWTMGFAAGAMLYIISHEVIPETHRGGFENLATFSLLGGVTTMIFLDAAVG